MTSRRIRRFSLIALLLRILSRETLAARARVPHVRIVELEAGAHQAVDVVDGRAREQHHALRVDDQLHAVALDRFLAGRRALAELHEIGVARTTAAAHADPERLLGSPALLQQLAHLDRRARGQHHTFHGLPGDTDDGKVHSLTRSLRLERFPSVAPVSY